MAEIPLSGHSPKRDCRLVIDEDHVTIHAPTLAEPWTFDPRAVSWVEPRSPDIDWSDDTLPAVIPRLLTVRMTEDAARLMLVFTSPQRVPAVGGRQRWSAMGVLNKARANRDGAYVDALLVSPADPAAALTTLQESGLLARPYLETTLSASYGLACELHREATHMQSGWRVAGRALTRRGDYWYDPRPVARTPKAFPRHGLRPRNALIVGGLVALAMGLSWPLLMTMASFPPYAFVIMASYLAMSIRRRAMPVRASALLGAVSVLLSAATLLLGYEVLAISQVTRTHHVGPLRAAVHVATSAYDWSYVVRMPFTPIWQGIFVVWALSMAWVLGRGAYVGVAIREGAPDDQRIRSVGVTKVRIAAAAMLVLGLAGAAGVLGYAAAQLHAPQPVSTATPRESNTVQDASIDDLPVGACAMKATKSHSAVQVPEVSGCGVPHFMEVVGHIELPRTRWPGVKALDRTADRLCAQELAQFVALPVDTSGLNFETWTPDKDDWASGNRVLVCTVDTPNHDDSYSLRNSGL